MVSALCTEQRPAAIAAAQEQGEADQRAQEERDPRGGARAHAAAAAAVAVARGTSAIGATTVGTTAEAAVAAPSPAA